MHHITAFFAAIGFLLCLNSLLFANIEAYRDFSTKYNIGVAITIVVLCVLAAFFPDLIM